MGFEFKQLDYAESHITAHKCITNIDRSRHAETPSNWSRLECAPRPAIQIIESKILQTPQTINAESATTYLIQNGHDNNPNQLHL